MKYLYRLYQLLVCLPILVLASIITSITTVVGCMLGNGHFWGYYPGKIWSQLWIRILLLPVKVEGRENLEKKQSYVFVANHQGAFDIFLIYGFLGRNFKWMMKKGLRKIPLVGVACEYAHHIFVDKSGPSKIRASYDRYGRFPSRCFYVGRRTAVACLSSYHQWQFPGEAAYERYFLGVLASVEVDYT